MNFIGHVVCLACAEQIKLAAEEDNIQLICPTCRQAGAFAKLLLRLAFPFPDSALGVRQFKSSPLSRHVAFYSTPSSSLRDNRVTVDKAIQEQPGKTYIAWEFGVQPRSPTTASHKNEVSESKSTSLSLPTTEST
ncbi:hypothetical protein PRIPAC_85058 [Pristionchus pacificus]|uniref:Uncharacterized protein n=1 Tax=Pristionchus pacificus TaxID=54126 RepID=A0A2A6BMS9_PRIPA|nr:hypothetical protein PRIPAC_85058 [Pristionchus pacificus]|eukprot:PDM67093.1 hypothetical protein PRIPAC_48510 [Pristionchus pacificus]